MKIIFDTEGVTVENGEKGIILKFKPLKALYFLTYKSGILNIFQGFVA